MHVSSMEINSQASNTLMTVFEFEVLCTRKQSEWVESKTWIISKQMQLC